MTTLGKMDQARVAVAVYGKNTYTTSDIRQALDGYINTPQLMIDMRRLGEIEIAERGANGRSIVWRTVKLRPVKHGAAIKSKPAASPRDSDPIDESQLTQSALRLQAALDKMTRKRLTSQSHPRKTNHQQGAYP